MQTVRKVVLILEYDGTHYYGFQLQPELPTVQGEMEKALLSLTGEQTRVIGASRTDTGVHARGQVVSFRIHTELPDKTFVSGLNHYLPQDIAVKEAHDVNSSFDVRRDAVSREYKYYILNSQTRSPLAERFCHRVSEPLDIGSMNAACGGLLGEHDFISFASALGPRKKTVRTVLKAEINRDGEFIIFDMVANSFLPHQVRNTVGPLLRVGLGRMSVEEFYSIMDARKAGSARPAAPACGLCLERVDYSVPFGEDDDKDY